MVEQQKTMRNAFILTARAFKGAVAYYAYTQTPGMKPRNIDKVMDAIQNIIDVEFEVVCGDFWYLNCEGDFYNYIKEKLMSIPEFVDWNLSQKEKEANISVDDPSRATFAFVSRYDYPKEEYDFVDLDAFIRNVHRLILATEM